MNQNLLLVVKHTSQVGDDLLIFPGLSSGKYELNNDVEKIKIVTPDNIILEKDAEFSIPFDVPSREYWVLLPNTQKDEVPIGSQIWIYKSLSEITK